MKSKFVLLFVILCSFHVVFSQVPEEIKEEVKPGRLKRLACHAKRTGDNYVALEYYKRLIELKPDNIKFLVELGELYRITRNYIEAEVIYKAICEKGIDLYPDAQFYLATMQKANGNCDEAKENLIAFKKIVKGARDKSLKNLYKTELEGCKLFEELKDTTEKAKVIHLNNEINNPHIEFSPIPLTDDILVFGSLRQNKEKFYNDTELDTTKLPSRHFYIAKKSNEKWVFDGKWDSPFEQHEEDIVGNGTFSLDSNRFYFTKCIPDWKYKMNCDIYYCEKENGKWGDPKRMNEQINLPGFTSTHPTVGRESKKNQEVVYFVSDRPKGKGRTDIWYVEYNARKKQFGKPKNAGSAVNSPGNEVTPYYDLKSRTLYFSTDGLPTIGNLDIYMAIGEKSKFNNPVNVGLPINSKEDDLDFALKPSGKGGFFVSNRNEDNSLYNSTCCDDIFEFTYTEFIDLLYSGKIINHETGEYISDNIKLNIYILDKGDKYLSETIDVSRGNFNFKLRPGFDYQISTNKEGFFNSTVSISTIDKNKSDSTFLTIDVNKLPNKAIVLPSLNYEFNSAKLTQDAMTIIDTVLLIILENNPDMIIEILSHTDNKGSNSYNQKLSQSRAESVVKYLLSKKINKARLQAKGYGEDVPIAPNENKDGSDNPEGRALNRRTEFRIVGKLSEEELDEIEPNEEEE